MQCQAQDYTEDSGGREYGAQVGIRKNQRKDEEEQGRKGNNGKDIPNQRGGLEPTPKAKDETEDQRVESAYHQVSENCEGDQPQNPDDSARPGGEAHLSVQQLSYSLIKSEDQIDHQQHDRGCYAEEHDLVVAADAIHVLVVLPANIFWHFRKYLLSLIDQLGEKELAASLRGL